MELLEEEEELRKGCWGLLEKAVVWELLQEEVEIKSFLFEEMQYDGKVSHQLQSCMITF